MCLEKVHDINPGVLHDYSKACGVVHFMKCKNNPDIAAERTVLIGGKESKPHGSDPKPLKEPPIDQNEFAGWWDNRPKEGETE